MRFARSHAAEDHAYRLTMLERQERAKPLRMEPMPEDSLEVRIGDVWRNPRGRQYRVLHFDRPGHCVVAALNEGAWPKEDGAIAALMRPDNGWTLVERTVDSNAQLVTSIVEPEKATVVPGTRAR